MKNTPNDLTIFEEIDSSISFKEWRDKIAAKTNEDITTDDSNMEKIDVLFTDFVNSLKASDGEVKGYVDMLIEKLKDESADLIDKTEDGNIIIGGGSEGGSGVIFNDGLGSSLVNGILKVVAVELTDYFRSKNYTFREVDIDSVPHFRIGYSPRKSGDI